MPLFRSWRKTKHVLVYRPAGTPFTQASHSVLEVAIRFAREKFVTEFQREPFQKCTVIEIAGTAGLWHASLFEVPEA